MIDIEKLPVILCDKTNYYYAVKRSWSSIKYIVMHYTGNVNDTPENNCKYYQGKNRGASAHYYVRDNKIVVSVPPEYGAWSIGGKPYSKQPYYNKATNQNSISIEMCGSKNSNEASGTTIDTACELAAILLHKANLTPASLIRHYDVTGKYCPWWAVENPLKWESIRHNVIKYFNGDDEMEYNEKNYEIFKQFYMRLMDEQAAQPTTWGEPAMQWAKERGIINDGQARRIVDRQTLATVLERYDKTRK